MWKLGVMQNTPQTPEPVTGNRRDPSTSPLSEATLLLCSVENKMWCFCWTAQLPACVICLPVNLAIACGRHGGVEVSTVTGNGKKIGFLFSHGEIFRLDWTCIGRMDSCFPPGKFLIGLNLCWLPGLMFSLEKLSIGLDLCWSPGFLFSDWTEPVLATWIPVFPWGNFQLDWTCVLLLTSLSRIILIVAVFGVLLFFWKVQENHSCRGN